MGSNVCVIDANNKGCPLPEGCAIVTVSDKVAAHLVLKGIIDCTKEIEKLEKKMSILEIQSNKLLKDSQIEGYESKVPADVRKSNAEKSEQTNMEMTRIIDAIAALKAM